MSLPREPEAAKLHNDSPSPPPSCGGNEKPHAPPVAYRSIPARIIDSFRRDPDQKVFNNSKNFALTLEHGHSDSYDVETAIANTADTQLAKKLKTRHLQMIAIGGSIGEITISIPIY